jgi:hypothetical protein
MFQLTGIAPLLCVTLRVDGHDEQDGYQRRMR